MAAIVFLHAKVLTVGVVVKVRLGVFMQKEGDRI